MDSTQVELLKSAEPLEVGRRLRAARVAKGLTQSDVAGDGVSVAYISRIESGHRRPTPKLLATLAHKLDVSVDQLLGGLAPREVDEIKLELDYAELALESGEGDEAAAHAKAAILRLENAEIPELNDRAILLHARALDANGEVDDAILEFEKLIDGEAGGLLQIQAGIALSRTYRESGDLGRAIDTGERVLGRLADLGLESCDEAVQLSVTVAAAYFERGDSGHAVRICRAAILNAEKMGSATARASAYWNASVMQANRGDIGEAIPLAERALALLAEGRDAKNLARLRAELGRLQLAQNPPAVSEARQNLERAAADLTWSSATPLDRAWIELSMARATYLDGDLTGTRELTASVLMMTGGAAPLLEAEAKSLEGMTYASEGRLDEAGHAYQQAILLLSGIGADRGAAQLWFDLADQLDQIGMADEARAAYRRAAASTGLRTTAVPRAIPRSHAEAVAGPEAIPAIP